MANVAELLLGLLIYTLILIAAFSLHPVLGLMIFLATLLPAS